MKTVSMGTSELERRGGSHSRMSYNFCYKRRPLRWEWDGASLPHTRTSSGPRIVWGEGEGGEDKCMYYWEELQREST